MTTEKKPKKVIVKREGINLKPYIIGLGFLSLFLLVYISYRMYISERTLIPISIFALIAGAIFQSKRLTEKWEIVLFTAVFSFLLSFLSFLPGKREHVYNFENHIEIWPYCFLILFIIFTTVFAKEKVIPKLTEGITLLQSMAIIYWIIDSEIWGIANLFLFLLVIIGLFFAIFSIFHAFTHTKLTRTHRLFLSIWSTVIYIIFAIENIIRVFQNEQIENTENFTIGLYIGLQYFLLGISSVYIAQNHLMLLRFLPGRGSFFNEVYFKDLKELKNEHIKRYSVEQVDIMHSVFCIVFTGGIFYLNFHFKFFPKHIMIWIAFVTFPFILNIYDYFTKKSYR